MDSVDLLAREEEFIKLNKQIEKKTVSLMKQIENTLNKQDRYPDFSLSHSHTTFTQTKPHNCSNASSKSNSNDSTPKKSSKIQTKIRTKPQNDQSELSQSYNTVSEATCHCCVKVVTKNEDLEFLQAFVSLNVQLKVLPLSFAKDNVSVENVCKFMASKLKQMQEQIDKLQTTLDRKATQCDGHLTQIAELESDKLRSMNRCSNLDTQRTDMKNKLTATQGKLNEREQQYLELKSEVDKLKLELSKVKMINVRLEARDVNHSEETDRLKQTIEKMKVVEKDYRARTRDLTASHVSAISRLEAAARRQQLAAARQRALIDNLRGQVAALSADAVLQTLDKEFVQFLLKS